jgi:site-specific DNA-methyltransferase (adenine-specific)
MKLILGDSVDKLKELEDNSVDSIVTDPPYGLSFMGKKWDYDVPSQEIFEECLRVLKPGGHLLSFAGSRTYHRMAVRVEDAGFEIRDQIMWIYGSGFPKSHNIGKKVEQYEGWGTGLKPAHEPIVMARKPFKGTVVNNVLEWGTGGINIDESRVTTEENLNGGGYTPRKNGNAWAETKGMNSEGHCASEPFKQPIGRFPANVIHDGSDEVTDLFPANVRQGNPNQQVNASSIFGGESNRNATTVFANIYDSAARFFYCPKTSKKDRNEGLDEFEDKYYAAGNQAKAELKRGNVEFNANKGKGKDERHNHNQVGVSKNNHPTVKPTDLMLYLIRLVTPKGGTTLDPFMGSGSTGKAAIRGGFDFIGIEREKEYMEIAEARIQYEIDNPYNEETKTRTEVKKEVNEKVNKFFSF